MSSNTISLLVAFGFREDCCDHILAMSSRFKWGFIFVIIFVKLLRVISISMAYGGSVCRAYMWVFFNLVRFWKYECGVLRLAMPGLGYLWAICRLLRTNSWIPSFPKFGVAMLNLYFMQCNSKENHTSWRAKAAGAANRSVLKSIHKEIYMSFFKIHSLSLYTTTWIYLNLSRQWMDVLHRETDDFCSVRGFLLSIRDTLRIRKGGLLWCGHPCGPFLVLSQAASQPTQWHSLLPGHSLVLSSLSAETQTFLQKMMFETKVFFNRTPTSFGDQIIHGLDTSD